MESGKSIPMKMALPAADINELKYAHVDAQFPAEFNKLLRNDITKREIKYLHDTSPRYHTKLNLVRQRLSQNEIEKQKIVSRILKTKSLTESRSSRDSKDISKGDTEFKIPSKILRKYRSLIYPQDLAMLEKLLRPKIYLDIAIKDLVPVGRVFVQLFTEACPDVVLELVHYCTFRKLDKLDFIRIFPKLWIEAELQCRSDSPLKNPKFEHEMNVQSHLHSGVLSFSSQFLDGFQHGLINFTISFRPLHVANGTRLSFGLVTKGQKVFDILQDYGIKNGIARRDIVVVNCGKID